jgi:hypothetical protein
MEFFTEIEKAENLDRDERISVEVRNFLDLVDIWVSASELVYAISEDDKKASEEVLKLLSDKVTIFSTRVVEESKSIAEGEIIFE